MENDDGDRDVYLVFKNSSKVVPDNINATIIMSTYDGLVPVNVSWVDEPNVWDLIAMILVMQILRGQRVFERRLL
jgi:hypothetical protein